MPLLWHDRQMEITAEVLVDLHHRMVRIRRFEEAAGTLFENSEMPGFIHLYVGEEAVAAGVCATLRNDDQVGSTHRGHGHLVAKGGDLSRMMAELMGKATGYNHGKGGSMHICDLDLNMLGANGIVGGGIPIAVGAAFANKYRNSDTVAVVFFGDGATNIGAFHEAINMASALQLPAVFVCENNEDGEFTPRRDTMGVDDVVDRAAGYGIPGVVVDGMDVVAVYEAAAQAVARARSGQGPSFIEAKTYRFYNHHGVQTLGVKYRSDEEVARWRERDPIALLEERLVALEVMSADDIDAVHRQVQATVDEAVAFGKESPYPEPSALLEDVYTVGGVR